MTKEKRNFILAFVFSIFLLPFSVCAQQKTLTDQDLLGIAGNKYASGELPVGDKRYVTDGPKKGYIYLCRLMQEGGGAQVNGPWIHGVTWNILAKPAVQGDIVWNNAQFSDTATGATRLLEGNGLPVGHVTGIFPIQRSDPVSAYDRNPNSIRAQPTHDALPLHPLYSDHPNCMGGEAGIMLTGVPIFNGFDAEMRDAGAHEVQDKCQGHPQISGQYHYHTLSSCMKDIGEKTVIGYALDGFPLTGPLVAQGRYLTTEDLDECHGITSEIIEDGQRKITYHYVMTQDFPYSVSCFRGKPIRIGPENRQDGQNMDNQGRNGPQQMIMQPGGMQHMENGVTVQYGAPPTGGMPGGMQGGMQNGMRQPPTQALQACSGMSEGSLCNFTSPRGDKIEGTCRTPPNMQNMACMPMR